MEPRSIINRLTGGVVPPPVPQAQKSVVTITAPLGDIVEELKAHAADQDALAKADEAKAEELELRATTRRMESSKARDAADKIGALLA
jgi:hypothetical protein